MAFGERRARAVGREAVRCIPGVRSATRRWPALDRDDLSDARMVGAPKGLIAVPLLFSTKARALAALQPLGLVRDS